MVTTFDPSKPVKLGDGDFDVEVGVQQGLRSDGDCVYGRVIPKKVRHADLAEIPLFMGFQFDKPGPSGQMTRFTGKGEGTTVQSRWCTVRPADQVDQRIIEAYRGVRRPVKVELVVPVGIRERTIYAEFRDIPLK
jgi:hypothetical protein